MAGRFHDPGYVVAPTGCWIYAGYISPEGYPGMLKSPSGKYEHAHRVYYIRSKGRIPKGLHIDHLCHTPSCVNPDHLEAVTPVVNCRRQRSTKLTSIDVRWIRRHAGMVRQQDMAERFGVTQPAISMIVNRTRWS